MFSEPSVDNVFFTLPERGEDETVFAIEYLPGQFDQRADSCAQCIQPVSYTHLDVYKRQAVFPQPLVAIKRNL